jgi:hypothetical protein
MLTFVKTVHVQLPHERGYVRMLEILSAAISHALDGVEITYAKTFENSVLGFMTKLSPPLDHEIKCWMLPSSSMLVAVSADLARVGLD